MPGKAAWLAADLPAEGTFNPRARAGALARRDVATCSIDAHVGEIRDTLARDRLCAVVGEHDVVLGIVRSEVAALADDTPVERVLQPGPATVRPSIRSHELRENMERDGQEYVLVTTYAGQLLGIVYQEDLRGAH